jgi:hypothetical protein
MRRAVLLTIVVLGFVAGGWAQIGPPTNSFRNASSSGTGLLEDDLDLLIGYREFPDPSRIPLVDGKRLYTSLANIVDKNEGFFNNLGNGYFLIGGSGKVLKYGSLGAFYDRQGRSTPFALDPVVFPGMFGHGERMDVIHDTLGGQTRQTVINRTADAARDTVSTQILLGFGRYMWGTKRVGLAFYHSDNSQWTRAWGDTIDRPVNGRFGNFTYHQTTTNLVTGQQILSDDWKGTRKAGSNASRNLIGLAGWMPYGEKYSLGLQLMTGLVSGSPKDEAKYDRSFNRAGIESRTVNGSRKTTFTISGLTFDSRFSAIYKWSEATNSRVDLGFGMTNARNKSGDKFETMVSNSYTGTFFTSLGDTDVVAYSGSKDNAGRMEFFASTTSKLSDQVTLGMGFGMNSSNLETRLIGDETRTIVMIYRQNAGGQSPFDSTAVTTWTQKSEFDTTGSALVFFIPVGLEFHITKPIVFRLGANHRISSTDSTYTDQVVSWTTPQTRVTFGDGHSYEYSSLPGPFVSRSNTVKVKRSETIYTYGAGWDYSEHLQLDFMGFAHLLDLTDWKLSATFKF